VQRIWRSVKVNGHVDEVLAELEKNKIAWLFDLAY
jgi:peroxiredoxin